MVLKEIIKANKPLYGILKGILLFLVNLKSIALLKLSFFSQFVPHSKFAKDKEVCVICCGPKKSGTYLLHNIVNQLNIWEDLGICVYYFENYNNSLN